LEQKSKFGTNDTLSQAQRIKHYLNLKIEDNCMKQIEKLSENIHFTAVNISKLGYSVLGGHAKKYSNPNDK